MSTNGLAPFSKDAEKALIGAVMVNPDVFFQVEHLTAQHFFIVRHGLIWQAITNVISRRDELDFVSLQDELRAMKKLDDVGGAGYLLLLVNSTPSSIHADVYGQLVERTAIRRNLLVAAEEIKKLATDEQLPIEKVSTDAEARVLRAIGGGSGTPLKPIADVAVEVYDKALQIREQGKPRAVPMPWKPLDQYNLLVPGRYGIVAGRPGMGKSWVLLLLALHLAQLGHPVFFFSLEMTKADLTERALSALSGVQSQKIDNGTCTDAEWTCFTDAVGRLNKLPLYIETPPSGLPMTPALLRARFRRGMHQIDNDKMPFVLVDYIQHERMSGGERFEKQTRHRELSFVSAALAALAIDSRSHVIVAAQLGRSVIDRADKRPVKEDLKESGTLEQDAWWIMLLHSDDYYSRPQANIIGLETILDKNRGGIRGTEHFQFDRSVGRMV